jgi:predicted NACHT family NTPase
MAKDFISPFSDSLIKSAASDLYGGAKQWLAKFDPGGFKLLDYHSGLLNSFGFVQIMSMPAPRRLEQIYVGLRAVPDIKKYSRRVDLHSSKTEDERRIVKARKLLYAREQDAVDKFISELDNLDLRIPDTQDIIRISTIDYQEQGLDIVRDTKNKHSRHAVEFVNKHNRLIVLGAPGSGKTTLMKYLALVYSGHLAPPIPVEYLLPVFVPLREVKRAGAPSPTADWLRDLIVSCGNDISSRAFTKEWLEDLLSKGVCLILLDGVDEAPSPLLNTIFQSIKAFSTKYGGNNIVITCRAAAFERSVEGFYICETDEFNDDDIRLFVKQWHSERPDEANRLLSDIFQSELAIDFCRTPLLLTLMCVLYGYRRSIPQNRAELYEACVDALLFRWDTYRSVDRDPIIPSPISPDRKKLLLSRVAYRAFDKNIVYFKRDNIIELINSELSYLDLKDVSARDFLKEIESHTGLLVEFMPDVYCFSHLTFHEFFTCLYYHDTKEYSNLFHKAITESKYMEIFLMCLEKMYNADAVIMQFISHVANVSDTEEASEYLYLLLNKVLQCNVVMNRKLRVVLRELKVRLDMSDIDDDSTQINKDGDEEEGDE